VELVQFNLQAWLDAHGAKRAGRGQQVIVCPTCGKRKLTVDVERGIWHCWVCQAYRLDDQGKKRAVRGAGDLASLLVLVDGMHIGQALQVVETAQDPGLRRQSVARLEPAVVQEGRGALGWRSASGLGPVAPIAPPEGWQPIARAEDWSYLARRGLTMKHVRRMALVVCTEGRYAGRLVFPVLEGGQLVYWQARAMWEAEEHPAGAGPYVKSLNPPYSGVGKSDVLLGLDEARQHPRVAVVEGPIDQAHAGPASVATFGKEISMKQVQLLMAAGVKALDLMWDGPTSKEPQGAWPEMLRAAALLGSLFDLRLVRLPYGDPGIYDERELDAFRARAQSAAEFGRLQRLGGG
jgi:hypothetical protein